jgi:fucose permease
MLIYLTILYFLYFGLESSYSVWIPTYSVLAKISSKEEATAYSLVFYLSMAISRFVLAIPTKSKTSSRTQFSLLLLLIISVLAVLLHFTYPHFGCYFVSILYGFAMSPLYSWYLAISH